MNTRAFRLHGPDSDFAQTQPLAMARPAHQDTLRFFRCACSAPPLVRIRRSGWMRLFAFSRLYRCLDCGARVLRAGHPQQNAYGARYLPPRPLRVPVTPDRCSASVLDGVYRRITSAIQQATAK